MYVSLSLVRRLTGQELNMKTGGQWEIPADSIEFTAKLGSGTSGQVFKGLYNRQGKRSWGNNRQLIRCRSGDQGVKRKPELRDRTRWVQEGVRDFKESQFSLHDQILRSRYRAEFMHGYGVVRARKLARCLDQEYGVETKLGIWLEFL